MRERDALIAQAQQDNLDDFMDQGPRLSTNRMSWVLARSGRGHVLRGGLGAFGIGRMWGGEQPFDLEDPTYEDAPIAPSTLDDFGDSICETCGQRVGRNLACAC